MHLSVVVITIVIVTKQILRRRRNEGSCGIGKWMIKMDQLHSHPLMDAVE